MGTAAGGGGFVMPGLAGEGVTTAGLASAEAAGLSTATGASGVAGTTSGVAGAGGSAAKVAGESAARQAVSNTAKDKILEEGGKMTLKEAMTWGAAAAPVVGAAMSVYGQEETVDNVPYWAEDDRTYGDSEAGLMSPSSGGPGTIGGGDQAFEDRYAAQSDRATASVNRGGGAGGGGLMTETGR